MAKKQGFFSQVMSFLAGEGLAQLIGNIEHKVDRTMEKAEVKIENATRRVVKASITFVLVFLGLIFALIGLSKWIEMKYLLQEGMGLIVIGIALVILGLVSRWLSK